MPPGSRHDSPDELKRGSFHLLPDYGIILPPTRATLCHGEARNDASPRFFRKKIPLVTKHSRQNSTLAYTLHPSPFWDNSL